VRHFSLPGFAAALAETREIEREGGVAAFGESQRIDLRHLLLDRQPRACDENARLPCVETLGVPKQLPDEPDVAAEKRQRHTVNHKQCLRNRNGYVANHTGPPRHHRGFP
jgi:hypothetical protein